MGCSWTLGNGAFVGYSGAVSQSVLVVVNVGAKVNLQDLYNILPVQHFFGNIMGGVFWRPMFTTLEEGCTIILVNAQHMKAVPDARRM